MVRTFMHSKREHLKSEKSIDLLFGEGMAFVVFPIRVVYQVVSREEGEMPIQVMYSVPKKSFHHAVDRNKVKRYMREAYRLNKLPLQIALVERGVGMNIAFLCVAKQMPTCDQITSRMIESLRNIGERL